MTDMNTKVAIITRTKDRPVLLKRAMKSVLQQTYQNWIHVIINDGGYPQTVDVVLAEFVGEYAGRCMVIHNQNSIGMQNASNKAIQACSSKYVIIHDDDDSWEPEFLSACVGYLENAGENSNFQGVITDVKWVFEEFNTKDEIVEIGCQDYMPNENIGLFQIMAENRFPPISFLYRRQVHNEIGYFNQQFDEIGDWDFNIRFLLKYDIGVVKKRLANYHWRHKAGGTPYGNTVTDGRDSHLQKDVLLRNHYLREDIQKEKLGLGYMMNVSKQMLTINTSLNTAADQHIGILHRIYQISQSLKYFTRITQDLARWWQMKDLLARISENVRGKKNGNSLLPEHNGVLNKENIEHLIDAKTKILSLDIFDTALFRWLNKPTDVFLYIQDDIRHIVSNKELDFVVSRITTEHIVRKRAFSTRGDEDITLDEIYTELCKLLDVDIRYKSVMMQKEIDAETHICYANPYIISLIRQAKERGCKIFFVTDMYLSREVIEELLSQHGFEWDEIFVSSEYRKTKHTGSLFREILRLVKESPEEILHIGDNINSDVIQAEQCGIRAYQWDSMEFYSSVPLVDQHELTSGQEKNSLISSIFSGLTRKRQIINGYKGKSDDILETIGYEVIGPLYFSFVQWVMNQATKHNIHNLFFLGRDGYYPIQVFEILNSQWQLPIHAEYMHASRRLNNLSRITVLDEEAMNMLLTPNPGMKLRHLFDRIGLNPIQYMKEIKDVGFISINDNITTKTAAFFSNEIYQRLKALFLSIGPVILEKANQERTILGEYFKSIGFQGDDIAIVDLGWQASSVKALQDLLRMDNPACNLRGYYFATWHLAQPSVNAGCLISSFFFHLNNPTRRRDIISESVELVECFFSAPTPTVVGMKKEKNEWMPIYGESEVSQVQQEQVTQVCRSALNFVNDAIALIPELPIDTTTSMAYLECVLDRLLRCPEHEEAKILGEFTHRTSFGSGPIRKLAKPPTKSDRILHPKSLKNAYDYSFWKSGLRARLSPEIAQRMK